MYDLHTQKVFFKFYHTFLFYRYTFTRNKNCHQHSYGFQNLMSSWGSGSKISKLHQVGDFSLFLSKNMWGGSLFA